MRDAQRTHILLIEDDESIRNVLGEVLGIEGYKVTTAENGQIGLEKLRSLPQACVVLLDLNMPIMNGWEFMEAKKAEQALNDVQVIVLSAVAPRSQLAGALCQLSKPIELDRLLGILREHAA